MSGPHPWGGSRQGLRGALGGADVGGKLVPVGLRQVLPHLLVPGLLQVVGGGVLQVGLHLRRGVQKAGVPGGPEAGCEGTGPTRRTGPTFRTSPGTGGGDWKWTGVLMAGVGGPPSCGCGCCCCM